MWKHTKFDVMSNPYTLYSLYVDGYGVSLCLSQKPLNPCLRPDSNLSKEQHIMSGTITEFIPYHKFSSVVSKSKGGLQIRGSNVYVSTS